MTLSISSPEVLDSNTYSEASDWWSFGCLLYEMTVGKKPFDGLSFFQLKQQIKEFEPYYPTQMDRHLRDLIKQLLQKNPAARPSFEQIKGHAFFRKVDFKALAEQDVQVPSIPRLEYDSDTFYFDSKFTKMKIFEDDACAP